MPLLKEIYKQVDDLQSKINSLGKLSTTVLNKINYKFRLEWNYHSNAMEGNSLSKEETRSVMINNITVEGKPLKDVMEIRGHDAVISDILKIGKGELRLSEKRIKEIHKAIMHEEVSEQQEKIGVWKTVNNYLTNYKDERYDFVPPADVPDEMHKLLNWLNAKYDEVVSQNKDAMHPIEIAFNFHIGYVSIHPFYDGNGRTARILMNLILIAFGYPPIIIKTSDKKAYNQYLADIQAYDGDPRLFYGFMAKLLIQSQELVLKAINGENIEEPSDLDKEIDLLKRELVVLPNEVEKSQKVISNLWDDSLLYLKNGILDLYNKLAPLFSSSNFQALLVYANNQGFDCTKELSEVEFFKDKSKVESIMFLQVVCKLNAMKKHAHNSSIYIKVDFSTVNYKISNHRGMEIKKTYSEKLTTDEIDTFIQQTGKAIMIELNQVAKSHNS